MHEGTHNSAARAEAGCKYSSKIILQGSRTKQHAFRSSFALGKEAGIISSKRSIRIRITG
jgi:hypothetical protein